MGGKNSYHLGGSANSTHFSFRYQGFWHWWTHNKCMMWPALIVLPERRIDWLFWRFLLWNHSVLTTSLLRFPFEARFISALPWTPGHPCKGCMPTFCSPVLEVFRTELWAVIRPDILWFSVFHQQRLQGVETIVCRNLSPYSHAQRFAFKSTKISCIL